MMTLRIEYRVLSKKGLAINVAIPYTTHLTSHILGERDLWCARKDTCKKTTSFLLLTTEYVSACGLAPLNYTPLNYEWHGIMEIINGVRFADANEADELVCYSH